jgi:LmbE family N-acetylglucosaminyl deacetylase
MQRQMGQEPFDPEAPFQPRGVPDETVTVWVDCTPVWKTKHEALLAHATQRAEIEEIPEDVRPLAFGLETFVQAWPDPEPGTRLGDLFEGL